MLCLQGHTGTWQCPPARKGSGSLFQKVSASWSPPGLKIREHRGGLCPHPTPETAALGPARSPLPTSPAPGTHLLLLLLGLWREETQVGDSKVGTSPGPPRLPWAEIRPYLRRGEAIAGSRCRRGPRHCQLSWGRTGGSGSVGGPGAGSGGVPSLPGFLLLLEPHGFQALGAGDEGDVPPLLH